MAPPQSRHPKPAPPAPTSRGPGRGLLWPALAVILGALLVHNAFGASTDPKPRTPTTRFAPGGPRASASVSDLALPRSVPKRLSIPSIAVNAPFTPLSLASSGELKAPPPDDKNLVGWFQGGATPGERGASIIAGHVDTKSGPAVFALLSSLKAGSTVDIMREDGVVATFEVDDVESFSKADFPNDRVYANTPGAELRVITCGGAYDHKVKDYKENVVVFARLVSTRQT